MSVRYETIESQVICILKYFSISFEQSIIHFIHLGFEIV